MRVVPGLSSEVTVEKENRSEEEECQQSKRITGVAPEEGHRLCGTLCLWVGLRG